MGKLRLQKYKTRLWYIYEIKCKVNNKTYIGMRCPPLGLLPENDFYMGSGYILKKAIKKYGISCFVKSILWTDVPSKKVADYLERYTIWQWRKFGGAEYNIADGGQGGYLGDTVNLKRRKSLQGHKCDQKTRIKISNAHKGKRRSLESINKQLLNSNVSKIAAFGLSKTIREWSRLTGMAEICLRDRLKKDNILPEVAVSVGSQCILDFFIQDNRSVLHPLKNKKYNTEWETRQNEQDKLSRNTKKRKKQSEAWKKYRKNHFITAWGLTKIEKEWIEIVKMNRGTLRARLNRGIPAEVALSKNSNCILRLLDFD